MKSAFGLSLLAPAFLVLAQDDCSEECTGTPAVYFPVPIPVDESNPVAQIEPCTKYTLPYASKTSATIVDVTNKMKYPTVLLETIQSLINVDCTPSSVQLTFNDSSIFGTTQTTWANQSEFVMITNHFGDCDEELERGFFLVNSVVFNALTLTVTAHSTKSNISETAETTEIFFGKSNSTTLASRAIVLDPTYTLSTDISLPETVIYSYDPYLTVTADKATFEANVTFSGYLAYNWLTFKLSSLYFDIDAGMSAGVALSADVTAAYDTTLSYSPAALYYGVSIPGILELGPQLTFAIDADVSASGAVSLTTEFGIDLVDGNVHLDFLDKTKSTTSGWIPIYTVEANVSAQVAATFNPTALLTVELAIKFFGGLLDLSSGVIASPGFTNNFVLSASAEADLGGVANTNVTGTCSNGLYLDSDFVFAVDVFATQFWSIEVYNVTVPIVDECFSWA
ncbi:hypothetical protein BJ875DRAFT_379168 [Amylocarpus encephaloides]|uniref:Isoamyl alcohol oxidase n=1 Tax=Amylocarpus encephaloides TaxID=45428 RepID=A0A9P8C4G2_9HELO|nr:hypothetical protein BJ875DRAFT_379168 [Amylocarpus encephaloides]